MLLIYAKGWICFGIVPLVMHELSHMESQPLSRLVGSQKHRLLRTSRPVARLILTSLPVLRSLDEHCNACIAPGSEL